MPTEFIAARYAADFQCSGNDGCADTPVGPADPRVVSRVGGRIELAASLACPGAARRGLLADPAMELVDLDPAAASALTATQSSPADPRPYARYFDGDERDVLGRYAGSARALEATLVVRVTADCPLLDPAVVDAHVERMTARWRAADFVTNTLVQTFPLGLAVEAMPLDTLERMDRLSTTRSLREHVTTLAYERPELFAIETVLDEHARSAMRWTVDYPSDLEFVRAVYRALYRPGAVFGAGEVYALLASRPDLGGINAAAGVAAGAAR